MLAPEDRKAVEGLFERLQTVADQNPDRDPDAVALIEQRLSHAPAAPYYMAQTVLVQEHALSVAQDRIAELERELAQRPAGGGLFGGLFGGGQPPSRRAPARLAPGAQGAPAAGQQGGGFLAGAAQTALGVTGGVLLGSAIAGMLSPGQAMAEEEPTPEEDHAAGENDFGGLDDMEF
ncbi:DUF2076 domain-containing protein [Devosia sp. 1635]|uniref:DUF2076 domain-containing protein n=1 Tax=Devosia sp. 1635 TaxID=2726066 RepID=UPI001563C341|nr:DUF2076 domain-containing protein [Devosia sp. 1635]